MIISASYRTDIPAFYGEWFMNRLQAGYCMVVNPYNRQLKHVNLQPDKADGIVFWTKNIGPFIKHLPEVQRMGFPFVIQHTINSYPRALEKAVIKNETAIEQVRRISDRFGKRVCVWRYDTIIDSSVMPREHHLETFTRTAKALEGAIDDGRDFLCQVLPENKTEHSHRRRRKRLYMVGPCRRVEKRARPRSFLDRRRAPHAADGVRTTATYPGNRRRGAVRRCEPLGGDGLPASEGAHQGKPQRLRLLRGLRYWRIRHLSSWLRLLLRRL